MLLIKRGACFFVKDCTEKDGGDKPVWIDARVQQKSDPISVLCKRKMYSHMLYIWHVQSQWKTEWYQDANTKIFTFRIKIAVWLFVWMIAKENFNDSQIQGSSSI